MNWAVGAVFFFLIMKPVTNIKAMQYFLTLNFGHDFTIAIWMIDDFNNDFSEIRTNSIKKAVHQKPSIS